MLSLTFFYKQSSFFRISVFILLLPFFLVIPTNVILAQENTDVVTEEADDTPSATTGGSPSSITDWKIETGIPIAGLEKGTAVKDPGMYFNKIYTFAVSASMVVAIIMIVYAGLMWMTSPYLVQKKEAIDRMTGVALGVLLLLASNLILKTINPNLVNWDLSGLTSIEGLSDSIFGIGTEGIAGGGGGGETTGGGSGGGSIQGGKGVTAPTPYLNQIEQGMGSYGCAYNSAAMIAQKYDYNLSPQQIADGRTSGVPGADWLANRMTQLTNQPWKQAQSWDEIVQQVKNGNPVAVGTGFSQGNGHWMTIVGFTENGDVIVNDPYGNHGDIYNNGYESIGGTSGNNVVYDLNDFHQNFDQDPSSPGGIIYSAYPVINK